MGSSSDTEFTAYAEARWARLVRTAALLGCGDHDAQDVAQTTLIRCHRSWSKVRAAEDRDAYVHRVLLNVVTDRARRRWTGERPTERLPETAYDDVTDALATADLVRRALERLSVGQRQVVVLRYYAHLDERATAEALGIAPGTVKSRTARALAVLAQDPQLVAETSAGNRAEEPR